MLLLLTLACRHETPPEHWLFRRLDPGAFVAGEAPDAPNYALDEAWAALPWTVDGADVALAELPAADVPGASVFYLHPTTWMGGEWNGPWDDQAVIEATEAGGTLIQASVFNGCCSVWAPRYRQANGRAFVAPDEHGEAAIRVAMEDVNAAFDRFLAETDGPVLVAGHSQGSLLGARLLAERGDQIADRLVVAVLPGGTLSEGEIGLPACTSESDIGCVLAWNARGPNYEPNGMELNAGEPDTMTRRLCSNPLSWADPGQHVPAVDNAGALFFDTPAPAVKPGFCDAQCVDGALVITEMGDLERDAPSRLLLRMMGPESYHPVEYQLFYVDLRASMTARVETWWTREAGG